MWVTIVDRDGRVCSVFFSGDDRQEQWPGSRVISAQKANTANAFSLRNDYPNLPDLGRALASGSLYGFVLEQGSLFGLQHSNPVDTAIAYGGPNHAGGNANNYGRPNDPMVGEFIGGVNVFGGGLALYDHCAGWSAALAPAATPRAPITSSPGWFATGSVSTTFRAGSAPTGPTI
jgi:hypothetical protein